MTLEEFQALQAARLEQYRRDTAAVVAAELAGMDMVPEAIGKKAVQTANAVVKYLLSNPGDHAPAEFDIANHLRETHGQH